MKAYELELEGMTRVLKQQVEKTQIGQTSELRVLSKKLKMDEVGGWNFFSTQFFYRAMICTQRTPNGDPNNRRLCEHGI